MEKMNSKIKQLHFVDVELLVINPTAMVLTSRSISRDNINTIMDKK